MSGTHCANYSPKTVKSKLRKVKSDSYGSYFSNPNFLPNLCFRSCGGQTPNYRWYRGANGA